jgi:hypothetical protein
MRYYPNNDYSIIRLGTNVYCLLIFDEIDHYIYKLHFGHKNVSSRSYSDHMCTDTFYINTRSSDNFFDKSVYNQTWKKFASYKPIHFDRFKYLGKGFKLVLKRKKYFYNCIFGHSHIYWVKLQKTFFKKTKKYKFFFMVRNSQLYWHIIDILKNIKPVNRYTLRGVRTYAHKWIKRKGRKSIATHV